MSTSVIRRSAVSALLAFGMSGVALLGGTTHAASGSIPPAKLRADALAAAPSLDRVSSVRYGTAAQERAAADRDAEAVPFPDGGNANGIRWEQAGPGFSVAEIDTVIEYNAFCQWLRAARDGRDTAEALDVLDDVPQWPGFRDQPDDQLIATVVAEAHAGSGVELGQTLADCDASHDREVAYAQSRGATPST